MEVQSAFNSGVQGFQNAQDKASQAARDIVETTSFQDEQATEIEAQESSNTTQASRNNTTESAPNLTQSVVDLKVAEHQARSSVEVIKTADENLGTLLDVRV